MVFKLSLVGLFTLIGVSASCVWPPGALAQNPSGPTPTPTPILPPLSVRFERTQIEEGGSTIVTVTLPSVAVRDVPLRLTAYNGGSQFRVLAPANVVVRAGEMAVRFSITLAQDEIYNDPLFVQITISAPGYAPAFGQITGINDDRPRMSLSFDLAVVREDAGEFALRATLRANRFSTEAIRLRSSRPDRVAVPDSVFLFPGTFLIAVMPDPAFNAPETITITASADNLDATTATFVLLDASAPRLSLKIAPNVVEEPQGASARVATGTVLREGDVSQSISVALQSSDTSEARVQPSLVFAAGQPSASFPILGVDDQFLDYPQTVEISANVAGQTDIAGARQSLTVRNANPSVASARLTRTAFSEAAGANATTLIVHLNRPYVRDLRIPVGAGNYRLRPRAVFIAAGQTTGSAPVGVFNDDRSDTNGNEYISVYAPFPVQGFPSSGGGGGGGMILHVSVYDDDGPLSLTLDRFEFEESDGPRAATGTVTRRGPTTAPLVVALAAEVPEGYGGTPILARVPQRVTIPAGAQSTSFPIDIVDNAQVAGIIPQPQRITARTTIDGQGAVARAGLDIYDDDSLYANLSLDANTIGENGVRRAIATLRVERPSRLSYTLYVSSSNPSRVRVPPAIVLPAGATQVQFPVEAIDNTLADGNAQITIAVRKPGFYVNSETVTVIDDDGAI